MIIHSEAAFTLPRPDCPHPEWWTAYDTDSTEREVLELLKGFIIGLQPEYVVETGTAWGYGAMAIGEAINKNLHGKLVSLEVDAERVAHAKKMVENAGYKDFVEIRQQSSMEFTPERQIDFAWFDSLFDLRVPEFLRYRPFMKAGHTIVAFHDTGPHHPLKPHIVNLANQGKIRPIFLPTPRGVCFAEVL